MRPDRTEETTVLLKRLDVLDCLCRDSAHIRDLVDETGHSRRTINRAVTELEAESFVERGSNGIEVTTAGRLARQRLDRFLSDLDDVFVAEDVLDALPRDADIDPTVVASGDALLASEPASFRPLERMHDELIAADRYRALVPTLEDARHVRLLYEHVVSQDNPAELVVTPDVFNTLREEFPRRMAVLAKAEGFSLLVGQTPPYSLGLFDHFESDECRVHLLVLTGNGSIHGSIVNGTEAALEWAERRYDEYRAAATERIDELVVEPDGGVQPVEIRPGPTLPASLERDGFLAVDVAYFGDEPVADPPTAWRAGLSLAEVHTGYAIERPCRDERGIADDESIRKGAEATDDGIASALETKLVDGSNCVLLGPPGSGKSTVCKQIACEWYADDRGPVLYRETGRGRPFEAVDTLVETVTAANGHVLVVVEDAVRQDASAVLDAMHRLAGREDVSFLLDAREHEWSDSDDPQATVADIDVAHVPQMRKRDCAILVEHFERTLGRGVGISADRLWSAVQEEAQSDSDGCHEMLRLTHRLATYAAPLTNEPTALEDDVAAVREEYNDDLALTVCTLATTLVAAGIGMERGLLYAVAEDDQYHAIDAILDRLEGRLLFPREDGSYRTVHEEWATTFLSQLLEDDENEASRRFRSAVETLLALADDTGCCRRISSHLNDSDALAEVESDPEEWAGDVVEAVYDLFWRRVSLMPLLGDGTQPPFNLPDACPDSVTVPGPHWIGKRFTEAGYLDRAERAYKRLDPTVPTERIDRFLGLGILSFRRGDYDRAIAYLEEGLPCAREEGDLDSECSYHEYLGLSRWRLGDNEGARNHCETWTERAQELGDRKREMDVHLVLGGIEWAEGNYGKARTHNEKISQHAQRTGDQYALAGATANLAAIATAQGAYNRADVLLEEALAIAREFGVRFKEANCLNHLGHVASERGAHEEARAYHEAALDIARDIEHLKYEGESHWRLGAIAISQDDLDDAERHLEEAAAIFEEAENQLYTARITLEQARLAFERGETTTARELAKEARTVAEDLEAAKELGDCRTILGRIALADEESERAREQWVAALETFEPLGIYDDALATLKLLVELCHDEGDVDGAHKWYRRGRELAADAPDGTAELHQEWLDAYAENAERA